MTLFDRWMLRRTQSMTITEQLMRAHMHDVEITPDLVHAHLGLDPSAPVEVIEDFTTGDVTIDFTAAWSEEYLQDPDESDEGYVTWSGGSDDAANSTRHDLDENDDLRWFSELLRHNVRRRGWVTPSQSLTRLRIDPRMTVYPLPSPLSGNWNDL